MKISRVMHKSEGPPTRTLSNGTKYKQICVRMPLELYADLAAASSEDDRSVGNMARRLIAEGLEFRRK